ncbi:MAG: VOC family protein [Caulobacteraceae bacterium]
MPRPIHFEIHAADPPSAVRFYSELLSWTFMPFGDSYHLIKTGEDGPGIDGGLVQRQGPNPDPADPTPVIAYVCTVDVDDVDAYVARAVALGGMVAVPKTPIPGVGWLAYVKDTQSNLLGLMKNDPTAA